MSTEKKSPQNWKDTVFKKIELTSLTNIDDDKLTVTLDLTKVIEQQAKYSFFCGVDITLAWLKGLKVFDKESLKQFFVECGYPTTAESVTIRKEEITDDDKKQ